MQQVINFNLPLRLIDARSKYSSLRSNISKCEKNKRCMWFDQKARAACVWSFTLWHQATIDIACHDHSWRTLLLRSVVHIVSITRDYTPRSLFYCLFAPHIYGCYSSRTSRSWWITHSTQRQRRGCNNIPSFLQRAAPFTRFFVKSAPGTTFTSWSQHHFDAIGKVERHVRIASHCGSRQQQR